MANKSVRSIEEQVEDIAKKQLVDVKYYTKTEIINPEIESALKAAPSKSGGTGANIPDIKLLLETKTMRRIPVMIEVKGKKGDFIKLTADDEIDNKKKDGTENFTNINKYAINGAVHYANAIVNHTESYKETIAIGLNGYYDESGSLITEIGVYYISLDNFCIPKKIGNYSDLSFLLKKNQAAFIEEIDKAGLTDEEIEAKAKEYENQIEVKLKKLNQTMQDTLKISVGSRVELVTGMIMAGLGTEGVAPLEISELKGETGAKTNDGRVLINKIDSFLEKRSLPQEKKEMIVNDLSRVFVYSDLWKPMNGESKLKSVYTSVKNDIMPIFTSAKHLDFTGKLFNVLNAWVDIPDSDKNDVVLTPRYVTELMAKLAQVNKDSYVWDYAVGSAGFLISSMKLMIKDAEDRIHSPKELAEKIAEIKYKQLLGIEKRSDIYLLAVLNMILMGDGSSNIIHKDSLTEYDGKYEQGEMNGKDFPANVFLLNPPYSAPGKGFIFVKKALSKMSKGRAAILIQENAGSGNGLPYTKDILENNTLLASIHMADIFKGKAGVQTAIYVFDVGTPHNEKQLVKFIDFSNDGYTRLGKKKSAQDSNLRNTNNAVERYDELANLVLYGKSYLNYFTDEEYFEDTISLAGNDWTFSQHKKLNVEATANDFKNTVRDFLCWKIAAVMKGELDSSMRISEFNNCEFNDEERYAVEKFESGGISYGSFKVGKLFDIYPTKSHNCTNPTLYAGNGKNPVVTNSSENNGRSGFSLLATTEKDIITFSDTTSGMCTLFYQEGDFVGYSHVQGLHPYSPKWTKDSSLYFVAVLRKHDNGFDYATKMTREIVADIEVYLPIIEESIGKENYTVDDIDFVHMENYIKAHKKILIKNLIN